MTARRLAALALALALPACATASYPQKDRLAPADAAALVDPDGAPADLPALWRAHAATVLVFWASTCPCVRRYTDRVTALRDRYAPRGVAFAFVAANADDDLPTLAAARADGRAVLPLYRDPGGRLAQTVGAVATPTAALVDPTGAVRFVGWIDNEHPPGDPDREPWLEDALDALLAGASPRRATPVWGCTITRSLGETPVCSSPEDLAPAFRCHE